MNICIMDAWKGKFTYAMADHWRSMGHKIAFYPPWEAMQQADVTLFAEADNQIVEASTKKIPHTGKVFVTCHDMEYWAGQTTAVDWSYVDGLYFVAQHIMDKVMPQITPPPKVALIKQGIDLNKFTMKTYVNDTPIRRIAYVVGDRRVWDVKRLDIAMQLLKDLMTSGQYIWQLHVRGTYSTHEQYNAYCKYLEKDLQLQDNLFWYPDVIEDMNAWLEDKDYFLLPSTKEAFSFATAEAMAKGIKPIINDWEGSKDTWGPFVCETYGQMLFEFLKGKYEPEVYRKYVEEHYNQDRYFKELDEFIGIGVSNT